MTLVKTSLPLARAFMCFLMFVYIRARFRVALIGGSLTVPSKLEAEFKFQRRSCKLSVLFPPRRRSAPESLLAGYWSLGLTFPRGLCVLSHVVRESLLAVDCICDTEFSLFF